jgi:hypothetical protein
MIPFLTTKECMTIVEAMALAVAKQNPRRISPVIKQQQQHQLQCVS